MSIDLFLYSPASTPPAEHLLLNALEGAGWYALSVPDDAATSGALRGGIIYAARDEETRAKLARALRDKDEGALAALFEREAAAYSCISIQAPYDHRRELGDEADDDLEDRPAKVAQAIREAKTFYCITTSAGRAEASVELQMAVAEALGLLVHGVVEDPQSGTYVLIDEHGRQEIDPTGLGAAMRTDIEKLTPEEAEALAAMMLARFGRHEGYRMAVDMLREFIKSRPANFGVTHAAWLKRVNRKFDMVLEAEGDDASEGE